MVKQRLVWIDLTSCEGLTLVVVVRCDEPLLILMDPLATNSCLQSLSVKRMAWRDWFSYSAVSNAAYHQHDLGISCAISGCSSDDTQIALRISKHLIVVVKESLACIIYEGGGNRVDPV